MWGHAGAFSMGAHTLVSLLPSEQLGIVVLANAFDGASPGSRRQSFFHLVLAGAPKQDDATQWNAVFDFLLFGPAIEAAKKVYA